ncbi:C-terminal-binding protein [Schistosoma japonicum]|uniref:C-terminal-binding protein n=1 Tax=Schistosoma japonicum TaxID=6182 RepID=A0A4Z2CXP6_SCHJA|nr:C-terminal-binding protein 1 [Schistosoma japonicum]TNN09025.1 C-terminal-binding protein [Schistosoma japonicum]
MPTTCGFPNCRFRSRYRGAEDNRHFYRVPKKPAILRKKWLEAIGRTEETIVSQLRVCSGHFFGGEKHEGDVPVADPSIDQPIRVELPPKIPRFQSTINRRNCNGIRGGGTVNSSGRGRGLHHAQGIRNKMCFLKSGMLSYMTKHNNCLNVLGTFKQKNALMTSNSTQQSSILRNDYKMRGNKPIYVNNTINDNNDTNSPIMWFNNLYSPQIYDYLKTIPINTSVSMLPELSTNNYNSTIKRQFYDSEKYFDAPTSIDKNQSILQQSPQQLNHPTDRYASQINTSRCLTPLSPTTMCLTNLIQNEDNNVLKKTNSSLFSNNGDNKSQSAFSSIKNVFYNNSTNNNRSINNDQINNNNNSMKSSLFLNKEPIWSNVSTDSLASKFTSTISLSNLSPDYFLSLASVMNDVFTQKFTENYLNPYNFQKFNIQHNQTNSKEISHEKLNIELNKQNSMINEYNQLNPINSNDTINNLYINDLNEIKDLSVKPECVTEYLNKLNYHIKNELYPLNHHYEQNNDQIMENIVRQNSNHLKIEHKNEIVQCNSLKLKDKFDLPKDIRTQNPSAQYVVFIGIDELTIERPILHDVVNLICVQCSELKNLPKHICQNVSDMVTYQEIVLSSKYLQQFCCLKNIYIPEYFTHIPLWDECKNLGINLHIVPLELDVQKSAEFIIGIILSIHYDIISIHFNEKNSTYGKRPASSPSQSVVNQLLKVNKHLYNRTDEILFKHTTVDNDSNNIQAKESIFSNRYEAQLNTVRNIQIGIIGLGPISLAIIRQLEKFNYTIRVFDKYLPDGIDTVLNLHYTHNYEEIIHESDWIIFIQETSVFKDIKLCSKRNDYFSLVINDLFNKDCMKSRMKMGFHIIYISMTEDSAQELITLNTAAQSGYVADIYALLRKPCDKLANELNIQRSPNLICLNNQLNKLQVQSEELRRCMSLFLRRNLIKNFIFPPKMNDEFNNKTEPQLKLASNNLRMNPLMYPPKKHTEINQQISFHGVKKHLTFGVNSLMASKALK